jgi:hypothetical protein
LILASPSLQGIDLAGRLQASAEDLIQRRLRQMRQRLVGVGVDVDLELCEGRTPIFARASAVSALR